MECTKCYKDYEEKEMVIDMNISVCNDCYDLVNICKTLCDGCAYYYVEDSLTEDYPNCKNKYCDYYLDDAYNIPLIDNCDCFKNRV